jgi:hypothetical protein
LIPIKYVSCVDLFTAIIFMIKQIKLSILYGIAESGRDFGLRCWTSWLDSYF